MDATQLRQRIGTHLRQLRLRHGLSQEELAERAQLHPTYISRIEAGRALPAVDVLLRLSEALDVWIEDFLYTDEERGRVRPQSAAADEAVTPAQIHRMIDSCTPAQLRLIKGLIEVVQQTPLDDKSD